MKMKKIFVILILFLILSISSSCGMTKNVVRTGKGDLVIEYTSEAIFTDGKNKNVNFIRLYDDKTISIGTNEKIKTKKDVASEEYQEIINYAFSSKFINLKEDLSDKSVLDGSKQYITLFFEDGTSKKTGGVNPTNKTFQKLYDMLIEAIEREE